MSDHHIPDREYQDGLADLAPPPAAFPAAPPAFTRDPLDGMFVERGELDTTPRKHRLLRYLRESIMPHSFCTGCGGGTVLNCFATAIDEMRIDPKEMVCVTGIGCSSWIPSPYFLCDTLHTTHGRAIAFAHGVKVMKPDMKVVIIAGDGDLAGIGGNHLIHAARRNIDLTVFLVNNFIYGMTGGQVSPTTPFGVRTTTTPYRNVEHEMRIADVVAAAGGTYVARWTTYHAFPLMEAMQTAIAKKGFGFIEIMSQCPVSYGRRAGMPDAVSCLHHLKEKSIPVEETGGMSQEELEERIVVGTLVDRERTEFTQALRDVGGEVRADLAKSLEEAR